MLSGRTQTGGRWWAWCVILGINVTSSQNSFRASVPSACHSPGHPSAEPHSSCSTEHSGLAITHFLEAAAVLSKAMPGQQSWLPEGAFALLCLAAGQPYRCRAQADSHDGRSRVQV